MNDSTSSVIRDIMAPKPVYVTAEVHIGAAVKLMRDRNIGSVVICGKDQEVIGIFTERDLLCRTLLFPDWEMACIATVMTAKPITIDAGAPWRAALDIMAQQRIRHLPVVAEGRLVGMLSARDVMEQRTRHLEELVRQRTAELELKNAALLERDRLMQYHLDVAGRIQRQMLPTHPPELPAFSIAVAFHPYDRVSGDYYDFMSLGPGQIGILLADASGHGVPAAFVSAMAKTAFQVHARGVESPSALLSAMNDRLSNLIDEDRFITMFYGILDRESLRLTYASAGHPPPLWYHHQGHRVELLRADGAVIGFLANPTFEERTVQLARGDEVLLYTDGVIECRDAHGELFGENRLVEFLHTHGENPGGDMVEELDLALQQFRGSEPFDDDVTCIGLSVHR